MDNLERFIKAHEHDYERALEEIKNGHKESHWMWYIFPQIRGLGGSEMSYYYGIANLEEARSYLENDLLRNHLIEITEALLKIDSDNILDILEYPDNLKLRSCMTLFSYIAPDILVFKKVIDKYYGECDKNTLSLIKMMKGEKYGHE